MMPVRPDVAARHLGGAVAAARFAEAQTCTVIATTAPMRAAPDATHALVSELLSGEVVDIYDISDTWAWGQARRDGYVGYFPAAALSPGEQESTHRVAALRTFLYPGPRIKATPTGFLPYGAELLVEAFEEKFARTRAGYVFAGHLRARDHAAADCVEEAERFLGVPYLWGGTSSLGLDCSGLVQTTCRACGIAALRDSDMQENTLGDRIAIPETPADFRRGDLLFWPGHVALARGDGTMIHATAYAMSVIIEPIGAALERISAQSNPLRTVRRLAPR